MIDIKVDWFKPNKRFIIKKIIDIIFIASYYLFTSAMLYMYNSIPQKDIIH